MNMPLESPTSSLQCQVCSRTFKRTGHLRRHERVHSAARPFRCNICLRSFARRDALRRHENSHLDAPKLVQLGFRACVQCAAAKTRCSGDLPCARCSQRSVACVYPQTEQDGTSSAEANVSTSALSTDPLTSDYGGGLIMPSTNPFPPFILPCVDNAASVEWDNSLAFATNWLDEPMGSDLGLSPLSWAFPTDVPVTAQNDSPEQPMDGQMYESHQLLGPSPVVENESSFGSESNSANGAVRQQPAGQYYVDGDSARLPRVKGRRPSSWKARQMQQTWSGAYSLHLPDSTSIPSLHGPEMSESNYQIIFDHYRRLCTTGAPTRTPFTSHALPSKSVLDVLISLFFERFTGVLPCFHWTIAVRRTRHYLLDLAIIAIGSQYLSNAFFSISLHEFLRRCLTLALEDDPNLIEQDYTIVAAALLNSIGLAYSGDTRMQRYALQSQMNLKIWFDVIKSQISHATARRETASIADKWQSWIDRESKLRLAYCIWLVDSMRVCQREVSPSFDMSSVTFQLPATNALWQAQSDEEWDTIYQAEPSRSTLMDSLQELYYHKTFSEQHPEFLRILVIHGLYHRLWEVERYYLASLSHWDPSSINSTGTTNPGPKLPPWLPSVPTFKKWQSTSCDALDVLHWQANSTIGRMRGLEHPTVMHLHFARVVLLCPCGDLLALARSLTSWGDVVGSREDTGQLIDVVRRWALYHQYKARLAIIHAGAILWHIRRHGIDAFYESPATALAILAMWSFSTFADRIQSRGPNERIAASQQGTNSIAEVLDGTTEQEDEDDSGAGSIILLDRPTDDELVQQFIRSGSRMKPHMGGVGDIFAIGAPPLILEQGVELLRSQECWGNYVPWANLLESLRKVCCAIDARADRVS